jgi:outer membrane biosynthesis protein TonB
MKTCILLALLVSAVSVNGQTLKEALYGGKLKTDTGTVIRKGDDLSTKIDTSTKKPAEPEKIKQGPVAGGQAANGPGSQIDSVASPATAAKDNNKIWKDYMDELMGTLRTEVLPSKKIKDGIYSVLIEYQIGTDGQVTVNSVSASPESPFLEQQVKERITLTAPQLTPLLNNYGKPRIAIKKQTITISK